MDVVFDPAAEGRRPLMQQIEAVRRGVRWVLRAALGYVLLTASVFVFTGGFVDFPCGRVYEDQGECLRPRRAEDTTTPGPRIDLYQTALRS